MAGVILKKVEKKYPIDMYIEDDESESIGYRYWWNCN